MKKLYFLRHGLSEMNVQRLHAGTTDTPLTEEGQEQAKKAGQAAKDLGIDLIASSPLSRAVKTAEIFARHMGYNPADIITNPLLIERSHGDYEGKPWAPDIDYTKVTGYENDDQLVARANKVLEWINSLEEDHILIVSHGAIGRAIRSLLKTEYPMSYPEKINNAELLCWVEED